MSYWLNITLLGCCLVSGVAAESWDRETVEVVADPWAAYTEVSFVYKGADRAKALPGFGPLPTGVELTAPVAIPSGKPEEESRYLFKVPVGHLAGTKGFEFAYEESDVPEKKFLRLVVKIPETVEARPRRLIWKQGEEAKPQTTSIACVTEAGVEISEVKSMSDLFTAGITRTSPNLYTLTVAPLKTDASRRTVIRVMGADASGRKTAFNVYAEVR